MGTQTPGGLLYSRKLLVALSQVEVRPDEGYFTFPRYPSVVQVLHVASDSGVLSFGVEQTLVWGLAHVRSHNVVDHVSLVHVRFHVVLVPVTLQRIRSLLLLVVLLSKDLFLVRESVTDVAVEVLEVLVIQLLPLFLVQLRVSLSYTL